MAAWSEAGQSAASPSAVRREHQKVFNVLMSCYRVWVIRERVKKNSNLMDEFLFKFLSSPPHTELATHNMIQERICNNKIQKLRETSERTVCIIWIGHTTQHSTDGRVECSRFNGRLMETFSRDIIHPCVVILELLSGCATELCVESVQMKFTFLMYSWKCVHN